MATGCRPVGGDDQDLSRRDTLRVPVVRAMDLVHARVERVGDRRDERHLEGPGGDHHLPGLQRLAVRLRDVAAASGQRYHLDVEPDRQFELRRVGLQVVRDVALARVGVWRSGEGQARQVVIPA